MNDIREIRHFHLFCGIGGGARGFNRGNARVGNMVARFRCIGGVDVDPGSIADFGSLTGVNGTVLDLFDRHQYVAFHGKQPPADWREATPEDIHCAANHERPHIVFLSAPCKGFSGLLSTSKSLTQKYQALNRLTERGVFLMCEAWKSDPPELIVFENVPLIQFRGRRLLDRITSLLRSYGYAVSETTHDCGELGGLAQSRKRFLLVARHADKVPPFLYEPDKRALQAVGDVLGRMPMPGDPRGGAMHRVPQLQWKTWVRLAFVEAGSDWRSLNKLSVQDGYLKDFLIVPDHFHSGYMGVNQWTMPVGAVRCRSHPLNGNFSVADPRFAPSGGWKDGQAYGVCDWESHRGTVTGQQGAGQGGFSVADPRMATKHNNCFRIVRYGSPAGTVTGGTGPSAGGQCVADPSRSGETYGKYAVTHFDEPAGTVIAGSTTGQGAFAVADPRTKKNHDQGEHFQSSGNYGVVPWNEHTGAIASAANCDNGKWSVADPRIPAPNQKLLAVIRALDGTWHPPFTTLELASLQSLVDPEDFLELSGLSDSAWRERIGNAVPPAAAEAIASVMGTTLLLAWAGTTFALGSSPIWVKSMAIALSVDRPNESISVD